MDDDDKQTRRSSLTHRRTSLMWTGKPTEIQSAALPYRVTSGGDVEILLLTTRRSGRWGLPKGRVPHGMSFAASAAKEAFEEAGIRGEIGGMSSASFRTTKRLPDGRKKLIEVWVYPLRVEECVPDFPERGQRDSRWFAAPEAINMLGDAAFGDAIRRLR